jgi:hypothetical protein
VRQSLKVLEKFHLKSIHIGFLLFSIVLRFVCLFCDLFLDQICECPVPVLRAAAGGDALHSGVLLAPGKQSPNSPPPPPPMAFDKRCKCATKHLPAL